MSFNIFYFVEDRSFSPNRVEKNWEKEEEFAVRSKLEAPSYNNTKLWPIYDHGVMSRNPYNACMHTHDDKILHV